MGEIPALASMDAAAAIPATHAAVAMPASGPRLIVVAWIIEIVVILIGFMLALFAGVEHAPAGFITAVSAAAPFAAGAVVEMSRIPLVEGAFSVEGRLWRSIAIGLILLFGALTFNNLLFGFERAFNLRIAQVREAEIGVINWQSTVGNLERKMQDLVSQRGELERQLSTLRSEAGGAAGTCRHRYRRRQQGYPADPRLREFPDRSHRARAGNHAQAPGEGTQPGLLRLPPAPPLPVDRAFHSASAGAGGAGQGAQ